MTNKDLIRKIEQYKEENQILRKKLEVSQTTIRILSRKDQSVGFWAPKLSNKKRTYIDIIGV